MGKINLYILKLKDDLFRFMDIGVRKEGDRIVVSMDEYTKSLEKLEIRKGKSQEELMEIKMKTYRKYIRKLN